MIQNMTKAEMATEQQAAQKRIAKLERALKKTKSNAGEKNSEVFTALFESMALGVVYQDADGAITLANPAAIPIIAGTALTMSGDRERL
jgi:PAS domain-containing protein